MGTMLSSGSGWAPLIERMDELIEEYLKRNLKTGVSVAVSQRGRLLLTV